MVQSKRKELDALPGGLFVGGGGGVLEAHEGRIQIRNRPCVDPCLLCLRDDSIVPTCIDKASKAWKRCGERGPVQEAYLFLTPFPRVCL